MYPANILNSGLSGLAQDIAAPFYIFVTPHYFSSNRQVTDAAGNNTLSVISRAEFSMPGRKIKKVDFEIAFKNDTIAGIKILRGGETSCTSYAQL